MPRKKNASSKNNTNWDVLAIIHTENWQVNVLAWYTLNQPKKILMFVGEGMKAEACKRFFCDKKVVVEESPPLQRKNLASEHEKIITDFLRTKLQKDETCLLFRSGGKQLMREGMRNTYNTLRKEQGWEKRLGTSVLDQQILIETMDNHEWLSIQAQELELHDYFDIVGYYLTGCEKIVDNITENWHLSKEETKNNWKDVRSYAEDNHNWSELWKKSYEIALQQYNKKSKKEKIITFDILDNEDLGELYPKGSDLIVVTEWIGDLWEQVFAHIWLKKQLQNYNYKLYANVYIKVSGEKEAPTVTEMDYVAVFPNGGILVFECKADSEAATKKPSQAVVRNRLADRLTGLAVQTCFVIPALDANRKNEVWNEMRRQYPEDLNFQTIVVDLSNKNVIEPELKKVVEKIKKN